MAKKKQQKTGCGFPLLLALLCLFVAVAYWQPEIELPEPVEQQMESLLQQGKETLNQAKTGLGKQWAALMEKIPEDWREILPDGDRENADETAGAEQITLENLPEYAGEPYVILYGGQPSFTEEERTEAHAYERYSELDLLGRCGEAEALIGVELMPVEKREGIGMVKPSGWHTVRYDDLVDGKYLYNRCHLIGYQLTGENANEANLITGTRYMNVEGMLPFENLVADYVRETGNHVRYRVTPDFRGVELVARGVQMEAWSVEDNGEGIRFHVYCYNVQPGVEIRYLDGESWQIGENAA